MDACEKALLGFLENDKNQKKLYIVQVMAGNGFARMEKRYLKALKYIPPSGAVSFPPRRVELWIEKETH